MTSTSANTGKDSSQYRSGGVPGTENAKITQNDAPDAPVVGQPEISAQSVRAGGYRGSNYGAGSSGGGDLLEDDEDEPGKN